MSNKPLCVVQVDTMDTQAVRAVLTPLLGEGKRIPQLYPPVNRVNIIWSAMKNNYLTVINGGLMSVDVCKKTNLSLSVIENNLIKALDPKHYSSPANAAVMNQLNLLFWASLFIIAIYWRFLPKEAAPHIILLEVLLALYFLKECIKSINNAPKSHADALVIAMKAHTPLLKKDYDAIMRSIDNNQTLNLMQIRKWHKDEWERLSKIVEEYHPHLIDYDD